MKKLLSIAVLGLLWCSIVFADTGKEKERYDFNIAFLNILIAVESQEKEIDQYAIDMYNSCKKNLPKVLKDDAGVNYTSAIKELSIFSRIMLSKKGKDDFEKFSEEFMTVVMTPEDTTLTKKTYKDFKIPKIFKKINKENFRLFFVTRLSLGLHCPFAYMR